MDSSIILDKGLLPLIELGLVPDRVIRFGIRRFLGKTVKDTRCDGDVEKQNERLQNYIEDLKTREIAESTDKANEQHYEVPTEFFEIMLGPHLKYSSGFWPNEDTTLAESEAAMLELVCERAELDLLKEGDTVLDLGCGWGSCALYIANKYKHLNVVGASNSNTQREFILHRAQVLGLENVKVITSDINVMEFAEESFDRIVTNEMFEHMKNYEKLLKKVSKWMKQDAKLFVHIFTTLDNPYHFDKGFFSKEFFTGGQMPSQHLLLHFNKHVVCEKHWAVNGNHYSKTLEAWLKKMDENKSKIQPLFEKTYGEGQSTKWIFLWRLFNIACSESFKYNDGNQWFVSHYRFVKK